MTDAQKQLRRLAQKYVRMALKAIGALDGRGCDLREQGWSRQSICRVIGEMAGEFQKVQFPEVPYELGSDEERMAYGYNLGWNDFANDVGCIPGLGGPDWFGWCCGMDDAKEYLEGTLDIMWE